MKLPLKELNDLPGRPSLPIISRARGTIGNTRKGVVQILLTSNKFELKLCFFFDKRNPKDEM